MGLRFDSSLVRYMNRRRPPEGSSPSSSTPNRKQMKPTKCHCGFEPTEDKWEEEITYYVRGPKKGKVKKKEKVFTEGKDFQVVELHNTDFEPNKCNCGSYYHDYVDPYVYLHVCPDCSLAYFSKSEYY